VNLRLHMYRQQFDSLFSSLQTSGYEILGPAVIDGAISYTHLDSVNELPAGWTDEQQGGIYRAKKTDDGALFGYSVAQQSWKKFLFPPTLRLWEAHRDGTDFRIARSGVDAHKRAFLGVRACEIMAMEIQDRILMYGPYADPAYSQLRSNTLIVAVQCRRAGGTCFCVSMNSGPRVTRGFDILLTEIIEPGRHFFVVETGTEKGSEMLQSLDLQPAAEAETAAVERLLSETEQNMGRVLDQTGIKELLYRNYEHPRWSEVAKRCLTCTNCTIVCPTCFCANVEDTTDLTGTRAERWRRWDSCFTLDHSSIHGGCVRCTGMSRYRQWMTHKLATWIDQFGTSGCVGCGRCITWCPVGIDITEETSAIRASGDAARSPFGKKGE
jgi:sulfhydrogenase subunit beta (sulfur reductase)